MLKCLPVLEALEQRYTLSGAPPTGFIGPVLPAPPAQQPPPPPNHGTQQPPIQGSPGAPLAGPSPSPGQPRANQAIAANQGQMQLQQEQEQQQQEQQLQEQQQQPAPGQPGQNAGLGPKQPPSPPPPRPALALALVLGRSFGGPPAALPSNAVSAGRVVKSVVPIGMEEMQETLQLAPISGVFTVLGSDDLSPAQFFSALLTNPRARLDVIPQQGSAVASVATLMPADDIGELAITDTPNESNPLLIDPLAFAIFRNKLTRSADTAATGEPTLPAGVGESRFDPK